MAKVAEEGTHTTATLCRASAAMQESRGNHQSACFFFGSWILCRIGFRVGDTVRTGNQMSDLVSLLLTNEIVSDHSTLVPSPDRVCRQLKWSRLGS